MLGWAKRGPPSGGIGANKKCATQTVEDFIADAASGGVFSAPGVRRGEFPALVRKRVPTVIGYRGMRAIDRRERRRGGIEQGRPRVKFTQVAEMVGAAGWRRS